MVKRKRPQCININIRNLCVDIYIYIEKQSLPVVLWDGYKVAEYILSIFLLRNRKLKILSTKCYIINIIMNLYSLIAVWVLSRSHYKNIIFFRIIML